MDQYYSNLELAVNDETAKAPELVTHDETARAPERDYDVTAFEPDVSALAPQAVPDTAAQVLYDGSLPEVQHRNEESTEERALSHRTTHSALKWIWIIVALVIIVAIVIGVGLGIWHNKQRSLHGTSTTTSPSAPQNHNITPAAQFILDDTSLAAISLANGDRQLYFQDNSGLIQRAIRTATNNQWSTSANQNLSSNSNPKNYTPLAVIVDDLSSIELYYISESHFLDLSSFDEAVWSRDVELGGNYSTAVNTRSLMVTSIPGELTFENSTINSAILYYENLTGNVSALLQRTTSHYYPSIHGKSAPETWIDITSQDSKSLPSEFRNTPGRNSSNDSYSYTLYESDINATYSTPFTSGANFSGWSVGALFYSSSNATQLGGPLVSGGSIVFTGYMVGPNGTGNFNTAPIPSASSILQSDIAMFGTYNAISINNTQPTSLLGSLPEVELPNNSFPFARLASVTLADQSATFIYHQINGTTFAEEQWDNSLNVWIPSVYITVSVP